MAQTTTIKLTSKRERLRRARFMRNYMEGYLWLLFAAVVALPLWLELVSGASLPDAIRLHSGALLASILTFFFALVFAMIFGQMPLNLLREVAKNRQAGLDLLPSTGLASLDTSEEALSSEPAKPAEIDRDISDKGIVLLSRYAESSRQLANRLFSRSGVYLFVGVAVAGTGLGFFYGLRGTVSSTDLTDRLVALIPNFGILIFIELIAFFFLRQYRSAMDEFRYYESIQRRREEIFVLLQLLRDSDTNTFATDLVKQGVYFSSGAKLLPGETTEILEARKLEKSDLELLDKFNDLVGKLKGV